MRVAVITQRWPTSEARWEGHSGYQTVLQLAKRADVHVFYPEVQYPGRFNKKRPVIDRKWQPEGVPTTYVPYKTLPVVGRAMNGALMTKKLLPHVRAYRPDIILNYFIYPDGYAAVRIAKALGVPAVLTATGADIHSIPSASVRRRTQWALRNADFVSVVSQDLCDQARKLGADPARSRRKLNGCDTTVFFPADRQQARTALGLDADQRIALYVGRLDPKKGLFELVESTAAVHATHPQFHTYMLGPGPAKEALEQAIAKHDASGYIHLIPSVATETVAQWMAASDLVTLPSYNEGCPNVVVEALAAGRPVVATNVGGIPELMDDTCGRMVPPRDVPALTHALDEVLRATWDANAISASRGRGWNNVAADLYDVLEEVLAHRAKKSKGFTA